VVFDEAGDKIELDGATQVIGGETVSVNTVADIYAAQVYWLFGATGITFEGQRIEGIDTANYVGTGTLFNNVSAYPGYISGGWVRDSVTNNAVNMIDFTATFPISFAPDHVVAYATAGGTASNYLNTESGDLLIPLA